MNIQEIKTTNCTQALVDNNNYIFFQSCYIPSEGMTFLSCDYNILVLVHTFSECTTFGIVRIAKYRVKGAVPVLGELYYFCLQVLGTCR